MRSARPPRARLPLATIEILASVAQHRALSTAQIRAIHLPGARERRSQQVLAEIAAAGLLAHVESATSPRRLWFVTEAGTRAAAQSGALASSPRLLNAEDVAGPLRAHTFAVNEAAISFLTTARARGDEFGALAWRHEVVHPLRPGARGARRRALIADAVLSYQRLTETEVFVEQRFLELDRATLPVDGLVAELGRYAELFRAAGEGGEPLWRSRYPVFPAVLCVLAGARRELLERRRDTALALAGTDPQLARTPEAAIRVCLLEDLIEAGPFAAIFTEPRDPARAIDWLGRGEAGR